MVERLRRFVFVPCWCWFHVSLWLPSRLWLIERLRRSIFVACRCCLLVSLPDKLIVLGLHLRQLVVRFPGIIIRREHRAMHEDDDHPLQLDDCSHALVQRRGCFKLDRPCRKQQFMGIPKQLVACRCCLLVWRAKLELMVLPILQLSSQPSIVFWRATVPTSIRKLSWSNRHGNRLVAVPNRRLLHRL